MTIQDDLLAIFKSYEEYNFDPVECLQRCEEFLGQSCLPGGPCDPRVVSTAQDACNAYGFASAQFLLNRLPSAATSILIRAWNSFSEIQAIEGQRIYRAGISMYLAKTYLTLGDRGASLRWALLTQADDLLEDRGARGGAGRQLLLSALGMTTDALSQLSRIAEDNLSEVEAHGRSIPQAYPEDLITKFAFISTNSAQLFATPSSEFEYPLTPAYFRALLSKTNENNLSPTEKGQRLEDLATYIFLLLPGLVPRRNVLEETLAFETDLVVRNLSPTSTVVSDLLGRHFLVECKNWAKPVGVAQIGYFLYRIRLTHATFGILFASQGITGDQDQERAAYSLIRKAFHEDGTICIVVDQAALSELADSGVLSWDMILERIERVRFGRAR